MNEPSNQQPVPINASTIKPKRGRKAIYKNLVRTTISCSGENWVKIRNAADAAELSTSQFLVRTVLDKGVETLSSFQKLADASSLRLDVYLSLLLKYIEENKITIKYTFSSASDTVKSDDRVVM